MDNLRGSLFMVLAMLCFAIEDVFIKILSATVSPGQIIAMLGAGGSLVFAIWFRVQNQPLWPPELSSPKVLARMGCEAFGTIFFVSALALVPLTTASAVIQAAPLVVALGGVLFLGQRVGWRRWTAISAGLFGVLLILRPGLEGFDAAVILAVLGMTGLAVRDLITRGLDSPVSSAHLSFAAFSVLIPSGLFLCLVTGRPLVALTPTEWLVITICVVIGLAAYLAIVAATRIGDVAVISSFRYSRMIFALILGIAIFGERPDALTLLGAGIVIAAGLYALLREARVAKPGELAQ